MLGSGIALLSDALSNLASSNCIRAAASWLNTWPFLFIFSNNWPRTPPREGLKKLCILPAGFLPIDGARSTFISSSSVLLFLDTFTSNSPLCNLLVTSNKWARIISSPIGWVLCAWMYLSKIFSTIFLVLSLSLDRSTA